MRLVRPKLVALVFIMRLVRPKLVALVFIMRLVRPKLAALVFFVVLVLFLKYVIILKLHDGCQDLHQQHDGSKEELTEVRQLPDAEFSFNQGDELRKEAERIFWNKEKDFLLKYLATLTSDSKSELIPQKNLKVHSWLRGSIAVHSVTTELESTFVKNIEEAGFVVAQLTDSVGDHKKKEAEEEHALLGDIGTEPMKTTSSTLPNKEELRIELLLIEDKYEKNQLENRQHADVAKGKLEGLQELDLRVFADDHVGNKQRISSETLVMNMLKSMSRKLDTYDTLYEPLVEDDELESRKLTPYEGAGNNIMFTLRTTQSEHNKRLPLLMETWISKVNRSNIFLVSDGKDPIWQEKAWNSGMHYVLSTCSRRLYSTRDDVLCCRTGVEMALLLKKGNDGYDWLCHVDDDMYVLVPPLVHLLSKFYPKRDAVYLGRSGSEWDYPRKVMKGAKLGYQGQDYHFAVGGMYCLSRAMVELAKPYIVGGRKFYQTCTKTLEPDDVSIGFVVGVVLNKTLSRTEEIYTHGLHLQSTVDPDTLSQQVAFSYGFGSVRWGEDDFNAISVPNALFNLEEDESQFRSLYCHLYPEEKSCVANSFIDNFRLS